MSEGKARVRMLHTQIGVLIDGKQHVLIEGDVVELAHDEIRKLTGTIDASNELVSDIDGDALPCSSCGKMWRRLRGLRKSTTSCGDCSASTAHRLKAIRAA